MRRAAAEGNPEIAPAHLLTTLLAQTGGTAVPLLRGRRRRLGRRCAPRPSEQLAALPKAQGSTVSAPSSSRQLLTRDQHRRAAGQAAGRRVRLHRAPARRAWPPTAARSPSCCKSPRRHPRRRCSTPSSKVRGHARVTSRDPEGTYQALEKYGVDLTERGPQGQARPGHRPRHRDPPRRAGAVPAHQEQPGADRRARRRQDRRRRGPGPAHRRRRRARVAAQQAARLARPRRDGRRREVPRRVRGAAQGRARRDQGRATARSSRSSTSCTRSSARAPPRARWTRATCSSRCWPAASCA